MGLQLIELHTTNGKSVLVNPESVALLCERDKITTLLVAGGGSEKASVVVLGTVKTVAKQLEAVLVEYEPPEDGGF